MEIKSNVKANLYIVEREGRDAYVVEEYGKNVLAKASSQKCSFYAM